MSNTNMYELVRRDLLHREQQDRANFGTPMDAYTGRAAILDAYDDALSMCCYLRRVIEEMTIGDGRFDNPNGA